MSCPRCGSGAVYKNKCRECGFEVKIHRVTGANPAIGRVPNFGENTGAGTEAERAAAARQAAARPFDVSPVPWALGEGEDEEQTSADLTVKSRGGGSEPAQAALRAAAPGAAAPAAPGAKAPTAAPAAPAPGPAPDDKASWYAAAGMAMPGLDGASGPTTTSRRPAPPLGGEALAAAVVAGSQAIASAAGTLSGLGRLSGAGALLQAILSVLLFARVPASRALIPLVVLWDAGFAVHLALAHERLLAALVGLAGILLPAAFWVPVPRLRWGAALLGAAVALAGIAVPSRAREADRPIAAATEVAELGVRVQVPEGLSVSTSPQAIQRTLGATRLSDLGWRLAFEAPGALRGGLRAESLPPGAPVERLLSELDLDAAHPPARDDALVPPSLAALKPQGWVLPSGADRLLVLLVKAPDGRAFMLCAQTEGLAAPARELFQALARGLEIGPAPPSGVRGAAPPAR